MKRRIGALFLFLITVFSAGCNQTNKSYATLSDDRDISNIKDNDSSFITNDEEIKTNETKTQATIIESVETKTEKEVTLDNVAEGDAEVGVFTDMFFSGDEECYKIAEEVMPGLIEIFEKYENMGCAMKKVEGSTAEITIGTAFGNCYVHNYGFQYFESGELKWTGYGIANSEGEKYDEESVESDLAFEFLKTFPELEDCNIDVMLREGELVYIGFTPDDGYSLKGYICFDKEIAESLQNYVIACKVLGANTLADRLATIIDTFLVEADIMGCGMHKDNNSSVQLSIVVEDKIWYINNNNTEAFRKSNSGKLQWIGYGEGCSTDKKVAEGAVETNLAIEMACMYPEIENAYISAWIEDERCKAVYYAPKSKTPVAEIEALFGEGGWTVNCHEWSGTRAGLTTEGQIVGTFPLLESD